MTTSGQFGVRAKALAIVGLSAALATAGAAQVPLDTFDLPPGATVVIEFEVTIDNPVMGGASSVQNQGTLSGANLSPAVLTDDPDAVGAADPTVTQLLIQADLAISKADSADPVDAASAFSYTLDITNNGPDTASSVSVTDTLPAGVVFGSASGTGWSCGFVNPTVTCTRPSLAPGAAPQITIAVTAPSEGGAVTNDASVSSATSDPVPANNSDSEQTTVTARADLSVTKDDSADPVNAASAFSYTVNVSNAGPSTAASLTVTDTLPAGVAFVSASGTGWSCGESGGVVTCTRPTLAVGAAPVITINVNAPSEGGSISNGVTVATSTSDPAPGNDSDTELTTVTAQADLSISKLDTPDPVDAAGALSYTVAVANAGPSTATSVTVIDTLPAGVSFGSASGSGWSCGESGGVVTCTRPSLPVGAAPTITINVTAPDEGGVITNTASVDAAEADPVGGNDSDSEQTTVTAIADVSVTKDDGVTSVPPGGSTTYSIVVTNDGPSSAPGVGVADTFPAPDKLENCGWTAAASGGATGHTANQPAPAAAIADTLSMPGGSSVTYTVTCDVATTATGTISNTVTITSAVNDPTPGDHSATDVDDVQPLDYGDAPAPYPTLLADDGARHVFGGPLFLGAEIDEELDGQPTAAADGDDLAPGGPAPDDEDGVTFPAPLVACQAGSATVTASVGGGALSAWIDWNRNGDWADPGEQIATDLALAAGPNAVPFTVPCAASLGTTVARFRLATASGLAVTGQAADGEVEDHAVALTASSDLAITKDDGVSTAVPGQGVIYTIIASNAGPSPVAGVLVSDTFPVVLSCSWTSVAGGGATGNTNGGPGNLGDTLSMPVGSSVTYTVTCSIDPTATGSLSNTATIATTLPGTSDPNNANNSATDVDTLTPQADLSITKTDGATTEIPGTSVIYTVVASNSGPSHDPAAVVADDFPSILTGCSWTTVAAGGAAGNDDGSGDPLSDTVSLPPGGSVTYTISCTIASNATGSLVNTATATASVTDLVGGNNSATDTDTLTPEADVSITKTDGSATEVPGTSVVYTIVASNAGPSDDPNVVVSDDFPAILSGCSWTTIAAGGATGNDDGSGDPLSDTISLPAGGSVTYTATCAIAPSALGTLTNTATVATSVTDPTAGNNSATDADTLTPQVDLIVTKTNGLAEVAPGETITYTVTVTNAGPSDAVGATLADDFPAIFTPPNWTCNGSGGASCGSGAGSGDASVTITVPVGGTITFAATGFVDLAASGTISNTATATPLETELVPGDNSATDSDPLVPRADLELVKVDDQDPPSGSTLIYTITVFNHGPSNATAVVVTDDPFPAALIDPFTTGCAEGDKGVPTCTLGGIPVGGMASYTIEATIVSPPPATITNTACVDSAEVDPVAANDCESEDTSFDTLAPTVEVVTSVQSDADGSLDDCDTVLGAVSVLRVEFSETMAVAGTGSVATTSNWRVVRPAAGQPFSTVDCGGGTGLDQVVTLQAASWSPSQLRTTLTFADSILADGQYRLVGCESITDAAGNQLAGDGSTSGTPLLRTFRVDRFNALDDGHFDNLDGEVCGLGAWTSSDPSRLEIDTPDASGAPTSGSVHNAFSNAGYDLAQCVAVDGGRPHVLGRQRRATVPSGFAGSEASCRFYAAPACAGAPIATASFPIVVGGTSPFTLTENTIAVPPTAQSARCGVVVAAPVGGQPYDIWLDALFFGDRDAIFADGFESGDTVAWSATVPASEAGGGSLAGSDSANTNASEDR